MKHSPSLLSMTLLAALPLGLLLAGCGGGGSGLGSPTPTPTVEPVGRTGTFSGTLTASTDSYFGTDPFQPTVYLSGKTTNNNGNTFLIITAQGSSNAQGSQRQLYMCLHGGKEGFHRGQVLSVLPIAADDQTVGAEVTAAVASDATHPEAARWGDVPVSGSTVTITEYSPTTITLRFNTISFEPSFGPATGTLTLDGTLTTRYVP